MAADYRHAVSLPHRTTANSSVSPAVRPTLGPRRRRPVSATITVGSVAAAVVAFGVVHPSGGSKPRTAFAPLTTAYGHLALPFVRERIDTLAQRETLADLLVRAGLSRVAAAAAEHGAATTLGALPAGVSVTTRRVGADSSTAEIIARPAVDRVLHLSYLAGAWHAREERLPWHTDTITARATIASSLYDSFHAAVGDRLPHDARSRLVDKLASIFEYRVDVERDLERGDSLRVLVERQIDPAGTPHDGRIVAAALTVAGEPVEAVQFRPGTTTANTAGATAAGADTAGQYFDQFGKALRAPFLRAPLQFRRVSSTFGMRQHPILGIWKMHTGTDYAAGAGTPVRAVGDGTVLFAGRKGGYGNVLELRHPNGYVSRYGHLRAFAHGVRPGARVAMGHTVGFVGMTGLATAPHLHFEMLLGGAQRDPRSALQTRAGVALPLRERAAFQALRERLLGPDRQAQVAAVRTSIARGG